MASAQELAAIIMWGFYWSKWNSMLYIACRGLCSLEQSVQMQQYA